MTAVDGYVTGIRAAFAAGKKAARDDLTLGCNPYRRPDYRRAALEEMTRTLRKGFTD